MEAELRVLSLAAVMSKKNRELVILVGMPGSGKTYYCGHCLSGHTRLSQDEGPRSYGGIVRKLHEMLVEGIPGIVIDRTNPRREQRKTFAEMARAAGYYLRIVYFDIPEGICRSGFVAGRATQPLPRTKWRRRLPHTNTGWRSQKRMNAMSWWCKTP